MDRARAHAVSTRGKGKPVIIFGHGIGSTQEDWHSLVEHFSRKATTLTFSLAGSPGADPELFSPRHHAQITGFADDLAMLCAELGLRQAVYIGHSISAMAGALAQAADPGLFSRLVLINASPRYIDDPATGYQGGFSGTQVEETLKAISGNFAAWAAGFAPFMVGVQDTPGFATEFMRSLTSYDPAQAAVMFRAAFTSDYRAAVPRLSTPTLLLQSSADPAVPAATAQWLARAIPGARLLMLGATGHFPHLVDPAGLIAAMEAFVFGRD